MLLFITLAIPFSPATQNPRMTTKEAQPNTFTSCYVEADGDVSTVDWPRLIGSNMWKLSWFRPFGNDLAVVSYWRIVLDESSELAIYDRDGGDLLWEHDGSGNPQLRIIGFFGDYIPTSPDESTLHVKISGSALFIAENIK